MVETITYMSGEIFMKKLLIGLLVLGSFSSFATEQDVVRLFSSTAFNEMKSVELNDNQVFSSIEFIEQRDNCRSGTCLRTRTFRIQYDNLNVVNAGCSLIVEFSYINNEQLITIENFKKSCSMQD